MCVCVCVCVCNNEEQGETRGVEKFPSGPTKIRYSDGATYWSVMACPTYTSRAKLLARFHPENACELNYSMHVHVRGCERSRLSGELRWEGEGEEGKKYIYSNFYLGTGIPKNGKISRMNFAGIVYSVCTLFKH